MHATLYGIPMSHPVITARLMLGHKGVEVTEKELLAGLHPAMLAAAGFRPTTVPAVRFGDGRRVQGTLAIATHLEREVDGPSLYPADPGTREAVEEAELWGERVLQPVPRRTIRRCMTDSYALRTWFAREATPFPAPRATAVLLTPTVRLFARMAGASRAVAAQDEADLDGLLAHVDDLVGRGVLGGATPNAADFQIAPSIRFLGAFAHLRDRVRAHGPAWDAAQRVAPAYPDIPS